MTIPRLFEGTLSGWRRVLRQPGLVAVLVAVQLAFLLPFVAGLGGWARDTFASTPALDHWGTAPSLSEWAALRRGPASVLGDLTPLAAFASAEGIRSPARLLGSGGLGAVALVGILFSLLAGPFVAAVVLSRAPLAASSRYLRPEGRMLDAARELGPLFLLLLVPVLAFDLAAYWLVVVQAGRAVDGFLPEGATERSWLAFVLLRYSAWFGLVFVAHRLLDHARIAAVLGGIRRPGAAFTRGWQVLVHQPLGVLLAAVVPLLPLVFAIGAWSLVADLAGSGWAALLFASLGHGALLVVRQAQKCAVLFAETELQLRSPTVGTSSSRIAIPEPEAVSESLTEVAADEPAALPPPSTAWSSSIDTVDEENRRAAEEEALSRPLDPPVGLIRSEPLVLRPVDDDPDDSAATLPAAPTSWSARIESIEEENRLAAEEEALSRPLDPPVGLIRSEPLVLRPVDDDPDDSAATLPAAPTSWSARIESIEEENRLAAEEEALSRPLDPPVGLIRSEPLVLRPVDDDPEGSASTLPAAPTSWSARIETIEEENRRAASEEAGRTFEPPLGHIPREALRLGGSDPSLLPGSPPSPNPDRPLELPTAWDPLLPDTLPGGEGRGSRRPGSGEEGA